MGKQGELFYREETINLLLGVYLKNKCAYDLIRKSGITMLPYPSLLKKIKTSLRCKEVGDCNIYYIHANKKEKFV